MSCEMTGRSDLQLQRSVCAETLQSAQDLIMSCGRRGRSQACGDSSTKHLNFARLTWDILYVAHFSFLFFFHTCFNMLRRLHFHEKTGPSEPLFSQPAEALQVQTFGLHVKYKSLHVRVSLCTDSGKSRGGSKTIEAPQSYQSIKVKSSLLTQSNRADDGTEFNDKISTLNTCLLSSPLLL